MTIYNGKPLKHVVTERTKLLGEVPVVQENPVQVSTDDLREHLAVVAGKKSPPKRWGPSGRPFWAAEAPDKVVKAFADLGDEDTAVEAYKGMLKGTGVDVSEKAPTQKFGSNPDPETQGEFPAVAERSPETQAEVDRLAAARQEAAQPGFLERMAGWAATPVQSAVDWFAAASEPTPSDPQELKRLVTYGPPRDADPLDPVPGAAQPTPQAPTPGGLAPLPGPMRPGGAGFGVAEVDPAVIKQSAEATSAAAGAARDAARMAGETSAALSESSRATRAAVLEDMQQAEELGRLAKEAKLEHVQAAERAHARFQSTLEQASKLARTGIDPNRYWNSRDIGQKASAVISAALWGFAGRGMEAVQRLDALVAQDNEMQVQDRATAIEGLKAQAAGLQDAATFEMQAGDAAASARLLEQAAKYQAIKTKVEMQGMAVQDAQIQMNTAQISAELGSRIAGLANQARELAGAEANAKNTARFHQAQLSLQSREMGLRAMADASKTAKAKDLPEATQHRIAQSAQDALTARSMLELIPDAVGDRVSAKVRGVYSSDEQAKDRMFEELRIKWQKGVLKEALTPGERELIDGVLGKGSRTDLISKKETVERILRDAEQRLALDVDIARAGQSGDVEEIRRVTQKAGGTESAPAYVSPPVVR